MCVRSKIFGLHVGQHFFPFILIRNLATFRNKRAYGPWLAHLNPCQEERMFTLKYKSHSPTLKSILVITQIITKAYKATNFNLRIRIKFNVLPFYATEKIKAVHKVKHLNCIM